MSATRAKHKHAWQMNVHLDFCHYYTSIYTCTRCSATCTITRERDPKRMSSAMFMFEETYEEIRRDARGRFVTPHWEVKVCDRCEELKAGAKVRYDMVIVGKDGTVEIERHQEFEQRADEDDDGD